MVKTKEIGVKTTVIPQRHITKDVGVTIFQSDIAL
jgi:hypothetical protein